jgi:hypothetical protein
MADLNDDLLSAIIEESAHMYEQDASCAAHRGWALWRARWLAPE